MKSIGKLFFAGACVLGTVFGVHASEQSVLDSLISEANHAYLLGQRHVMVEQIDQIDDALEQYRDLRDDERAGYQASLLKLRGNEAYLRGCADDSDEEAFSEARRYYERARKLDAQRFSTGALIDLEMAQLYYKLGQYEEALECMEAVLDYYDTTQIYEPGDDAWNSAEMQKAIILARLGQGAEARQVAETAISSYKNRKSLEYGRARRMYAKIIGLTGSDRREALKAYKEYFALQKADALERFADMDSKGREEYWMMIRPFVTDAYALEGADPEFLYNLTLFAKGLLLQLDAGNEAVGRPSRRNLESLSLTWKDVRSKLKKGEAAVEFIQYLPFDGEEAALAALVLRPGKAPAWISQPAPSRFEKRFGPLIDDGLRKTKDMVYGDSILPGLVWTDELMRTLEGANTIFFAPDGLYHTLAIEYLLPEDGPQARRLTSTRRLMDRGTMATEFDAREGMLLFGDIDYDCTPGGEEGEDNDFRAFIEFKNYNFPLLDADTDEARKIALLRNNPDDARQRGIFATEGSFRRLAGRFPSVLVSTHGISLAANNHRNYSSDLKPAVEDDVLSTTVLGFTSVNPIIRDYGSMARTHYDGLVSARELASLDLSKCKLFTLSACQTGLGEVTADGVYGLQRGLKNAGAGAMLVSLWSVQSDATARLMTAFYQRLNKGEGLHDAFRGARRDLKDGLIRDHSEPAPAGSTSFFNPATLSGGYIFEDYVPDYDFPQYTDAFILIDAID